jgi:hypothetical protein
LPSSPRIEISRIRAVNRCAASPADGRTGSGGGQLHLTGCAPPSPHPRITGPSLEWRGNGWIMGRVKWGADKYYPYPRDNHRHPGAGRDLDRDASYCHAWRNLACETGADLCRDDGYERDGRGINSYVASPQRGEVALRSLGEGGSMGSERKRGWGRARKAHAGFGVTPPSRPSGALPRHEMGRKRSAKLASHPPANPNTFSRVPTRASGKMRGEERKGLALTYWSRRGPPAPPGRFCSPPNCSVGRRPTLPSNCSSRVSSRPRVGVSRLA